VATGSRDVHGVFEIETSDRRGWRGVACDGRPDAEVERDRSLIVEPIRLEVLAREKIDRMRRAGMPGFWRRTAIRSG